jgi:hypothetical protein
MENDKPLCSWCVENDFAEGCDDCHRWSVAHRANPPSVRYSKPAIHPLRKFLKTELDECLRRCELIEVARSKYKRSDDAPARENLTRSLMHYEGRVRQIRRTFRALDGDMPIQEPFILDKDEK